MNATVNEVLAITAGAFLAGIGVIKIYLRKQLQKIGIKVNGVVIRIDTNIGIGKRNLYYPVFRFVTLENEIIVKRVTWGSNPSIYSEGEHVVVIYDPTDKNHFIIDKLDIYWQSLGLL
ncbi:DUF3592 domain-containing protein [Mucilaginibacter sabulilitoris]|uniref:DUF3592 domain-containing protein n=1 Tax=Mucilaginibacter sabulilitoris TaxID=1173583 RepID=A0ABZ0TWF6_9SPHI|nr:DUF3592 domain-containing protein [Mucilaginibacter sabulilitoris]WPU96832.1 DUF3592 domain-containing protein [Mucilaginibacter sabulilitoris]